MNAPAIRLGLWENRSQFALLMGINALTGAMVGLERAVLPALAEGEFGLAVGAAMLSFIAAFGLAKAAANYVAGQQADARGRRPVLIAGWLFALPVPLLLAWAPGWGWVIGANLLLGVSQGLAWSAAVIMKIDLAGPRRRGLAMGLNESAGYLAVAAAAAASGWMAAQWGLREALLSGAGIALAGLLLSVFAARETSGHAELEAATQPAAAPGLSQRQVFARTSLTDPDLSASSQAGFVNNLNDGVAWGLFPLLFAAAGMDLTRIGALAALYPAVWGLGQLGAGALSDRWGRRGLIAAGMWVQAAALFGAAAASTLGGFALASAALGLGTAMVYPTLLAAVGDAAAPSWRARAVGVYRLWRDTGYAAGALLGGALAAALGLQAAVVAAAALTAVSGAVVWLRMRR